MRILRAVLRGAALSVSGALAALLLLEMTVRVLGLAPPAGDPGWFWKIPDAQYGWSHQPNAVGRWFNPHNEYNVEVTINSKGLRDLELEYTKSADEFRILLLGDSYVEGMRVKLEQTFGKVLEQRLAAMHQEISSPIVFRVINAGVSAWGTDQALLWFRNEGFKYEADLVILGFFPGNDFMNNSEALETANIGSVRKPFFTLTGGELQLQYYPFDPAQAPKSAALSTARPTATAEPAPAQSLRQWLQRHSALYRFVMPMLRESIPPLARLLVRGGLLEPGQETTDAALAPDYIPVAYGVYRRPPTEEWESAFSLTNALLRALDKEVSAAGARLAVVILTSQEQINSDLWEATILRYPAMQPYDWNLEQPNRVLYGILDGANIPYLDLLPIFRTYSDGPLHLRHDGHWTPTAERLAGDSVADFVLQERLAPVAGGFEAPPTAAP